MKKIVILGGAIVALVAVIGIMRLTGKQEEEGVSAYAVVETARPERRTIELYTSLIGTVEPEQVERIYPDVAGTVTEIYVKAGDVITAGQPICTIDTKQVESAKNAVENAEVTYQEARTILGRMETLYQSGDIAAQEYEGYVNTSKKAEIAYRQAKEDYERQVSYSNITASINGKVEKCDMELLDRVSSGELLCVISGEGNRVISASLTENVRNHVKIGDSIQVVKSGNSYEGTVSEMSEMVDEDTGLYGIKIQMDDSGSLTTGTVVKLSVCSNRADQVLTIPVDSVYYENSLPYVFTFEEGTVHKVFIEAGIYDSEYREVIGGLLEDTEIIITWSPELYEGARAMLASEEDS